MDIKEDFKEVIEKYNIDIEKLEKEQEKLAKLITLKDSIDFNLATRIAGIENVFLGNKIISAVVVIENNEIIEQEYSEEKIRFPYIPGFRAYRELPNMLNAFNKLDEKPDLVLIKGHGIAHPKGIGIASHFAIAANIPTIGVADSLVFGEIENDSIKIQDKIIGKVISLKEGANPLYISPGNNISVKTSLELVKRFTTHPYKIPEPLRLARKYAKDVAKTLMNNF